MSKYLQTFQIQKTYSDLIKYIVEIVTDGATTMQMI